MHIHIVISLFLSPYFSCSLVNRFTRPDISTILPSKKWKKEKKRKRKIISNKLTYTYSILCISLENDHSKSICIFWWKSFEAKAREKKNDKVQFHSHLIDDVVEGVRVCISNTYIFFTLLCFHFWQSMVIFAASTRKFADVAVVIPVYSDFFHFTNPTPIIIIVCI